MSILVRHLFLFLFLFTCTGIEPWTFEQKLGEAVLIPAGCPHQVRNLKVRSMMISLTLINLNSIFELRTDTIYLHQLSSHA